MIKQLFTYRQAHRPFWSGCCQKNRETPADCGCMLGYTEQAKDERILKRFERAFVIPASKAR